MPSQGEAHVYSQSASIRLRAKGILRSTSARLYATALLLALPSIAHADTPPTVTFAGIQVTLTNALQGGNAAAVDQAGNVFIADPGPTKLLELPANGGAAIVLDNNVQADAVAVDNAGKVYVAVGNLDHLLVYTPGSASAPTSLGSGFSQPNDVSIDVHGNIYVADTLNNRVVKLAAGGGHRPLLPPALAILLMQQRQTAPGTSTWPPAA